MSKHNFMLAVTGIAIGVAACTSDVTSFAGINKTDAPVASVRPGAVSDLGASAIASTSVTLGFTQVDDGTGLPASYDVRYAVAPISWGAAASVKTGTCSTPVAGTTIGSPVTCTVLGLSPSTSYDFQLVPFRGTLNVDAVFGTLSNIVSVATTAARPGTVSDLNASAISGTSLTLAFTQVEDGMGLPASYDVRYAVAPISWGAATSTTSGTCTTPVAGTTIGSRVTCTVLGLSPSTSYDFQLIAFRGTLNVNAVFGGLSNVVSANTTAPAPVPVASVSVSPATSGLQIGGTAQLSAVTRDALNNVLTGRVVSWNSSNSAVATVSTSGLVTAVAAGSASITATSEGQTGSATVTVTSPPPPPSATRPGTVSDLSASAITSTSLTLSFKQVDDGAGLPASYDVRYAVAPISWGAAAAVTSGTCTTPVAGTAIGSLVTCTVLGLSPATNYNFQLIAFRGTLNVNAVFGGLSNIASGSTTASASVPPLPSPLPPPPPLPLPLPTPAPAPGGSHEPAGMTVVSDRPYNGLNELGWTDTFDGNMAFISDASAPRSPSGILRATFPPGNAYDGSGPGGSDYYLGNKRTLYMAFWIKYSANWYGHPSGVNKMVYAHANGSPVLVFSAIGGGTAPLRPQVDLQYTILPVGSTPAANLPPNLVPTAEIVRGQWNFLELVAVGNTAGNVDGSLDWYLNGVHVGSYSIQWTAGASMWGRVHPTTIWGGWLQGAASVPATMWRDNDHFYISEK